MKWIAISGSWKYYSRALEKDVKLAVRNIFRDGNSIVTGGALGVDYFATAEFLQLKPTKNRLKIFLPTTLSIFLNHYRNRAYEGVISLKQAEMIERQLKEIKTNYPSALIENFNFNCVSKESYYARNQLIVDSCDELLAFHVNKTQGTLDAITKAKLQKKKVTVTEYNIPQKRVHNIS